MSLPHVILGFLQYAPATGYDLKKTFDATVRHFWPADQSHIYRALAALVEAGAVQVEEIPQSGKPNRKLYRITERGREELMSWLREPGSAGSARNPVLVHVFFAGNLKDTDALALLEAYENGLREELACYRRIPSMIRDAAPFRPSKRERFFWMLTLEYGIALVETQLAWVRSVRERIRKRHYTSTVDDLPEDAKSSGGRSGCGGEKTAAPDRAGGKVSRGDAAGAVFEKREKTTSRGRTTKRVEESHDRRRSP